MNQFGTDTIAAWTAYGKIDGIFWMTMNSFGISVTTFSGQNYGAGKYDRVKKGMRQCLLIAMVVAICLSSVLYFGGAYVYRLFTDEVEVIEIGLVILRFLAPTFITYVSIEILSGTLRGMGSTFIPMIITCLGICLLRMIWVFIAVPVWPDMKAVIFSYPLTWVTTSILFILYYRHYVKRHGI